MEKVLCLVDVQNIWAHPIKNFQAKVDFKKLKNLVSKGRSFRGVCYLVVDAVKNNTDFMNRLISIGYDIKVKSWYRMGNDYHNTSWTSDIIRDADEMMANHDVLALVSGSDAYSELVTSLLNRGKRVEVYGWSSDVGGSLSVCASEFEFLDERVLLDQDLKKGAKK